jgi:hypothetical protein
VSKITLSGEQIAEVMAHAAYRGMTFEEYIQEYVALRQEEMKNKEKQEK